MSDSDRTGVDAILLEVNSPDRRRDASDLADLLSRVTGHSPQVWGPNTIGFGQYHYRYETGKEGDFFNVGFSPRKDRLTLYLMSGLRGFDDLLERLGPHTAGKSTVHLKRLDDVDRDVLIELIAACVQHIEHVEESLGAVPRMSEIPPRVP